MTPTREKEIREFAAKHEARLDSRERWMLEDNYISDALDMITELLAENQNLRTKFDRDGVALLRLGVELETARAEVARLRAELAKSRSEALEECVCICEILETWTEPMHDTKRAAAMKIRAAKSGAKP